MKQVTLLLTLCVVVLSWSGAAFAEFGWCGNVWPCSGTTHAEIYDIVVYYQLYKVGVTDQAGQGPGLSAQLYYKKTTDADYTVVDMAYNTDVGDNDEYSATIPAGDLEGGIDEIFYCAGYDSSDSSTCAGQDQCSNDPPFTLTITEATSQDVTVTFYLCLDAGETTTGAVCVTGSHPELTEWGAGVEMLLECDEEHGRYLVDVTFPAGSSPQVLYKYRKDGCETWQGDPNQEFFIDDSSPTQSLPLDTWTHGDPDCPECPTATEGTSWGTVKALYR